MSCQPDVRCSACGAAKALRQELRPGELCRKEGDEKNRRLKAMLAVAPVAWEFYRLSSNLENSREAKAEVGDNPVDIL
jgi:hypothetical protein